HPSGPAFDTSPCAVFSRGPCSAHHPAPHSFPTRRSSDLFRSLGAQRPGGPPARRGPHFSREMGRKRAGGLAPWTPFFYGPLVPRSEEHTSELQSRFDLVCRLLLEKKNCVQRQLDGSSCMP